MASDAPRLGTLPARRYCPVCSGPWAPRFLGVGCSRHVFRPVWALPSAWDFLVLLKGAQTLRIEFCWGKVWTIAQETALLTVLRNCCKEDVGKVSTCDFGEGDYIQ